jgi:outer membrane receptor protein involved in Fe transport
LWLTRDGYTEVTYQNIGRIVSEGIDLDFNYLLGLGEAGYLAMDLMGTYLLEDRFTNPVVDYNCTGYYGNQCGEPMPLWRHRLRATWESNGRFNLSLAWRYLGGTEVDDASPDPGLANPEMMPIWEASNAAEIPAYNWFDLAASYTMRNGLKFTVGVNNILDEEPPLYWNYVPTYDPLGRYIFGSVQFNF